MNDLHLYERKIISDSEFPVQLFVNNIRRRGEYFSAHWHEHIELHYVIEGRNSIIGNNQISEGKEGNLIIVNENELHTGYCDSDQLECLVIIFEMDAFSKEIANKNIIFQSLIEGDETVQKLMMDIYKEYKENQIAYKLSVKGMVYQLIVYLVRKYSIENLSDSRNIIRNKNLIRLNTVLLYIEEHYSQPIKNIELASLIHLSVDRFNHVFKEEMGISPLRYINELRLRKAKLLLKAGKNTVSEVALEVGFNDMNHFGRIFKKRYGASPSTYL